MNNSSENALIVVYDNKSNKYRVVNLLDKTISFSSFGKKCDAENLMNDMIYTTTDDIINDVAKYCCKEMQNNGWYIERKDNQINLQEEYSAHFVENIKICPWCGKKL